jgi:hypothetical protein
MPDELPMADVLPVAAVPDALPGAVSPLARPEEDPDDDVVPVAELVLVPVLSCRPHAESDIASAAAAAIQSCFMRSAPFNVEEGSIPRGNWTHPFATQYACHLRD